MAFCVAVWQSTDLKFVLGHWGQGASCGQDGVYNSAWTLQLLLSAFPMFSSVCDFKLEMKPDVINRWDSRDGCFPACDLFEEYNASVSCSIRSLLHLLLIPRAQVSLQLVVGK